jgi:hypothetical protein
MSCNKVLREPQHYQVTVDQIKEAFSLQIPTDWEPMPVVSLSLPSQVFKALLEALTANGYPGEEIMPYQLCKKSKNADLQAAWKDKPLKLLIQRTIKKMMGKPPWTQAASIAAYEKACRTHNVATWTAATMTIGEMAMTAAAAAVATAPPSFLLLPTILHLLPATALLAQLGALRITVQLLPKTSPIGPIP